MDEKYEKEFLDLLSRTTRGDKEYFYNLFINFIEKKNIYLADPVIEEQRLYDLACSLNLAGYNIFYTIDNPEIIQERFSKYYDKSIDTYFLFSYQIKSDEKLCFSSVFEKWDNIPPRGWIARFCKCGNFFPISLEINEMDVSAYEILDIFQGDNRPIVVEVKDIKVINFCTDNIIRFEMNDGTKLCCKPYKFDTSIIFGFIDDFSKLL